MNIVDLVQILYPKELSNNQIEICISADNSQYFITKWEVPGVPKPTIEELEAQIPQYERGFDVENFKKLVNPMVDELLNNTANEKEYDNVFSITSYSNSTNQQWSLEAQAFIAWRDEIYFKVFDEFNKVDAGAPIPSVDDFMSSLPSIVWPGA
jgi:hypothetical protein